MQSRRPRLRQAHAGADLFKCLIVVVVLLDQEAFYRAGAPSPDGRAATFAAARSSRGGGLVGGAGLHPLIKQGHKHRGEPTERAGQIANPLFDGICAICGGLSFGL